MKTGQSYTVRVERGIYYLTAMSTVAVLVWLLWYARYGFDFTDEGFYLNWISRPELYPASTTQFGYFYHPLYRLLSGDIMLLRGTNIVVILSLSWALSYSAIRSIFDSSVLPPFPLALLSAALATAGWLRFHTWLVTPSYNSLNLKALLVYAIGYIWATDSFGRKRVAGWVLIGIGGYLAMLAKPTSALALAVITIPFLSLARRFSLRLCFVAVTTALLLVTVTAFFIDESLGSFGQRIIAGLDMSRLRDGGYSLSRALRLDELQLDKRTTVLLIVGTTLLFGSISLIQLADYRANLTAVTTSAILVLLTVGVVIRVLPTPLINWPFQGLVICFVPFSATLLAVSIALFRKRRKRKDSALPTTIAVTLLFLLLPHIYAFGTNNNYWVIAATAGIFWALGGVFLLGGIVALERPRLTYLVLAIALQAGTVAIVQTAIDQPYRQPPRLYENNHRTHIAAGTDLILSRSFNEYIESAKRRSRLAGFETGAPMIDLTGQSPGLVYALGAKAIGQPWLIGGYSGSEAYAEEVLRVLGREDVKGAWILVEPSGTRRIPATVLRAVGLSLEDDYTGAAKWRAPRHAGGRSKESTQLLYRPKPSTDRMSSYD